MGTDNNGFTVEPPQQSGGFTVEPPSGAQQSFNDKLTEMQPWPKFDTDHPVASSIRTLGVALGNMGGGAIAGSEGLASFVKDALDPSLPLKDFYQKNIATIPDALKSLAQADASGHPEYALGAILPSMAAGEFGPEFPGLKGTKEAIGSATRDPVTGNLKPGVRQFSRLAGTAGGATLAGGPGAVAGALMGPTLTDMLLPDRALVPEEVPLDKLVAKARTEAMRAGQTAPGPWKPGRLPASSTDIQANPFGPAATFTNSPNLPKSVPLSQLGNPTPFQSLAQPDVRFVTKFEPPEPSRIVEPGSEPPPVNKTLVSYSRPSLLDMIKDPSTTYADRISAIRELRRNPGSIPKNVIDSLQKYMVEPAAGTVIYGGPNQ